jgi:hypothetical protein
MVSRTTGAKGATMAPVSNPSNKSSLLSSPSSSTIAPQVSAINQQRQHQQQQPQLQTISNDTSAQNYIFPSNSPLLGSGNLIYLGYNGGSTGSTPDSGSSGKSVTDTKSSHDSSTSTPKDNEGSYKNKSAGHKNDGGKSSSSSKTRSKSNDHTHHDSNESLRLVLTYAICLLRLLDALGHDLPCTSIPYSSATIFKTWSNFVGVPIQNKLQLAPS